MMTRGTNTRYITKNFVLPADHVMTLAFTQCSDMIRHTIQQVTSHVDMISYWAELNMNKNEVTWRLFIVPDYPTSARGARHRRSPTPTIWFKLRSQLLLSPLRRPVALQASQVLHTATAVDPQIGSHMPQMADCILR
jgi:hypothetical protein